MRLLILLALLPLLGCTSTPKSGPDFRIKAKNSRLYKKEEYAVAVTSLAAAKERLQKFSEKCLRITVANSVGAAGAPAAIGNTLYTPSIEQEQNRVTLYLQKDNGAAVPAPPAGGHYVFLVEVEEKNGAFFGRSVSVTWGLGNILEDSKGWVQEQSRYCPELSM